MPKPFKVPHTVLPDKQAWRRNTFLAWELHRRHLRGLSPQLPQLQLTFEEGREQWNVKSQEEEGKTCLRCMMPKMYDVHWLLHILCTIALNESRNKIECKVHHVQKKHVPDFGVWAARVMKLETSAKLNVYSLSWKRTQICNGLTQGKECVFLCCGRPFSTPASSRESLTLVPRTCRAKKTAQSVFLELVLQRLVAHVSLVQQIVSGLRLEALSRYYFVSILSLVLNQVLRSYHLLFMFCRYQFCHFRCS